MYIPLKACLLRWKQEGDFIAFETQQMINVILRCDGSIPISLGKNLNFNRNFLPAEESLTVAEESFLAEESLLFQAIWIRDPNFLATEENRRLVESLNDHDAHNFSKLFFVVMIH